MASYASQAFSAPTVRAVSDEITEYLDDNSTFVPITLALSQNTDSGLNAVLVYSVP